MEVIHISLLLRINTPPPVTSKSTRSCSRINSFFRAHHSHIINLRFVRHFSRTEGYFVTMSDGSVVEVSRRKKELFLQLMHA
ncbi:MAG: LytTR family transcriptional regulator [Bacteroidetes bacterium]|nr:LytTR family transcriptional regulator [Bacteroidota bacterium]